MSMEEHVVISVVVPVYKEEANIRPFLSRAEPVLASITSRYEIIFCLDPSPDRTEEVILEEGRRDRRIKLVVFSRRFGQPAATMAGIGISCGDTCVVIDVDLQDPPELIRELHARLSDGYDVVYARRRSRQGETLIKRLISWAGYKVIARLGDVQIPRDTGDFRIMSRRVVEELSRLQEGNAFLRGLVAFVGFPMSNTIALRGTAGAGTTTASWAPSRSDSTESSASADGRSSSCRWSAFSSRASASPSAHGTCCKESWA
jgi:glycosyltransferase involved in cell wall biosynthesis